MCAWRTLDRHIRISRDTSRTPQNKLFLLFILGPVCLHLRSNRKCSPLQQIITVGKRERERERERSHSERSHTKGKRFTGKTDCLYTLTTLGQLVEQACAQDANSSRAAIQLPLLTSVMADSISSEFSILQSI